MLRLHRLLRLAVLGVCLALAGTALSPDGLGARQDPGAARCPYPEASGFDFWVGEWSVRQQILSPEGGWLEFPAESTVTRALDGCALVERWRGTVLWFWEGMNEPEEIHGLSVRAFDPSSGEWAIHWMDTRNPRYLSPYRGSFRDGAGTFVRESVADDGTVQLTRIRFHDIRPDGVEWELSFSPDRGSSWTALWKMSFTRR